MKNKANSVKKAAREEKNSQQLFWGLFLLIFASAFLLYVFFNVMGFTSPPAEPPVSHSPTFSPPPTPTPRGFGPGKGRMRRPPGPPPAFMMGPNGTIYNKPENNRPERPTGERSEFYRKNRIISETDRLPEELKNVPPESKKALLKDVNVVITSDAIGDVFLDDTRGKRFYGSTGEKKDTGALWKYELRVKLKPGKYMVELKGKNGRSRRSVITVIPLIDDMHININMKRPED
ncbi:MAG: hypothetical protein LWY06_08130 [Firmicutes bacterium]|nr:hypothetical protein [Bacillota bacterium]